MIIQNIVFLKFQIQIIKTGLLWGDKRFQVSLNTPQEGLGL